MLTPKLAAAGLASTLLLTGCSVNAPVTNDIHDNYVDVHENTVNTPDWKDSVPTTKTPEIPDNPLDDVDPNAPQDVPEPWSSNSVDPAPTFSPPSN